MSHYLKISVAILSGTLFLSGCASTGMSPSTDPIDNNYQLPQEIYDGYWAMTAGMDGQAAVINFRDGMTYNYRFKCYTDGNFEQVGVEQYKLRPNRTAVGLQHENNPEFSQIKVVKLTPKQNLTLNQSFSAPELQEAYPNGQMYNYVYKPTLEPLCTL